MPQFAYVNFFTPDATGNRGGAIPARQTRQGSGNNFPYDRERGKWGEPWAYSRDSSGHGPSRAPVPVPKGISADDSRWKTAAEALGVPFHSDRAGRGTSGPHAGGRVMPGTSGQWGGRPIGGPWDNHVSDDELEKFGEDVGMPMHGSVQKVRPHTADTHDPSFDRVPTVDVPDADDGILIRIGGTGFGTSPGQGTKNSRSSMPWRESVHRSLVEAFISMKDTPQGQMVPADDVSVVDRDVATSGFRAATDIGRVDPIGVLMSIDPDYLRKVLSSLGNEQIHDIYERWAEDVLSRDVREIEDATSRIAKGGYEDEAYSR